MFPRHVEERPGIGFEHAARAAVDEVGGAQGRAVVESTLDGPSGHVHGHRAGVVEFDPFGVALCAAFDGCNRQNFVESDVCTQPWQVGDERRLGLEWGGVGGQGPRCIDDLLESESGLRIRPFRTLGDGLVGPHQVESLLPVVEHRGAVQGDDGTAACREDGGRRSVGEVGAYAVKAEFVQRRIEDVPIGEINAAGSGVVEFHPFTARPRGVVGARPWVGHDLGHLERSGDDVQGRRHVVCLARRGRVGGDKVVGGRGGVAFVTDP